jgi:hypothetical protein
MPWTSLGRKELREREMSTMRVRNVATDDETKAEREKLDYETLDILNWLRGEYRTGVISRVAFVEQATALGIPWLDVEFDAYRIDTEDDQI